MRITHKQAQEYLQLQADGGLNPAQIEYLYEHLSSCSPCRAFASELESLRTGLMTLLQKRFPAPQLSSQDINGKLQAVQKKLDKDRRVERLDRVFRALAWGLGLMALAIVLGWSIRSLIPAGGQPPGPTRFPPGDAAGLDWAYDFHGVISGFQADSGIYAYGEVGAVYRLDLSGRPAGRIRLPAPLKVFEPEDEGQAITSPLAILPDGGLLALCEGDQVYAINTDGSVRWEFALDSPAFRPLVQSGEVAYVLDEDARLYAFDRSGLRWRFESPAAPHTASGLAVGPAGGMYYTVTSYSRAFIQALSKEGKGLWTTEVETQFFYNDLKLSADGSLLALHEELFDSKNGQRLVLDGPERLDEYVPGLDGRLYVRSGHKVMQVEITDGQLQVLRNATLDSESYGAAQPVVTTVDERGVIWMRFKMDDEQRIAWLSPDGLLLGEVSAPDLVGYFGEPDYRNSRILVCLAGRDFQSLECKLRAAGAPMPIWEATLTGTGGITHTDWDGDRLYFMTWMGILHALSLR